MSTSEERILQLAQELRKLKLEGTDRGLSEPDTKAILVEPLLEIAGWAVLDPTQVSREDRPTERPVDYALKIGGKAAVLVECKRLSNPLASHKDLEQALAYASSAGVRWCVLTNGSLFRIYNSLAPEVAEKKLVEEIDLAHVGESDGPSPEGAVQTLQLISPESIEAGRIDEAWNERYTGAKIREVVRELWRKPDPGLVNLVRQRMKERGRTLSKKETGRWLRSLDVTVESRAGGASAEKPKRRAAPTAESPTRMKLGTYQEDIKHSYEILTKTAEWLIGQGKLKASDCPISSGRRRNIVNAEPKHRDGGDFRAPRKLSNGLWVETHHSTAGCIGYAKRLLERFGYSEGILVLE
jgi:hypothetical protein